MKRCKCGSYAINQLLHGHDDSDGDLCDVCYWRKRAEVAEGNMEKLRDPKRQLESTTDMMMELVERLGELPVDVDPRAWSHLLVYAPQRQPLDKNTILNIQAKRNWPRVQFADKGYGIALDTVSVIDFARAIEAALGIGDKT